MRLGVLTGGGDCPGLNAVIRAVVIAGHVRYGYETLGYLDGWRGVLDDRARLLDRSSLTDCSPSGHRARDVAHQIRLPRSGGPSGSSRTWLNGTSMWWSPSAVTTLSGRHRLGVMGVRVVGVPKTIDNDSRGPRSIRVPDRRPDGHRGDRPPGHDRRVAPPHHRVRGHGPQRRVDRDGGRHRRCAAEILVPEVPFDLDEVCAKLLRRHERGSSSPSWWWRGALPARAGEAEAAAGARSGHPRRVRPRTPRWHR